MTEARVDITVVDPLKAIEELIDRTKNPIRYGYELAFVIHDDGSIDRRSWNVETAVTSAAESTARAHGIVCPDCGNLLYEEPGATTDFTSVNPCGSCVARRQGYLSSDDDAGHEHTWSQWNHDDDRPGYFSRECACGEVEVRDHLKARHTAGSAEMLRKTEEAVRGRKQRFSSHDDATLSRTARMCGWLHGHEEHGWGDAPGGQYVCPGRDAAVTCDRCGRPGDFEMGDFHHTFDADEERCALAGDSDAVRVPSTASVNRECSMCGLRIGSHDPEQSQACLSRWGLGETADSARDEHDESSLSAERDVLMQRVEELERELTGAKSSLLLARRQKERLLRSIGNGSFLATVATLPAKVEDAGGGMVKLYFDRNADAGYPEPGTEVIVGVPKAASEHTEVADDG